MALEFFRAVDCRPYIGDEPKTPALEITVREPILGQQKEFAAPVDTGFAGYLLLPRDAYERLGAAELPREDFGVYATLAGPVVLRRALVTVAVGRVEMESYVETPMVGVGKLLVGRRLLSRLDLALLGTSERCCLLKTAQG